MKKYIFSLFILYFSFLFLAGCSNTQTPQSIQLQGTTIVAPEYDDIKIAGKFILAKKDGQSAIYSYDGTTYNLIAPLGTYLTEPEKLASLSSTGNTFIISNGFQQFLDNQKFGLIDLNGNIVVPLTHCEFYIVQCEDSTGTRFYKCDDTDNKETRFYNGDGNLVARTPNPFGTNVSIIQKDGQFYTYRNASATESNYSTNLYDKDGNPLFSSEYRYISYFNDNCFIVQTGKDRLCGVIDWDGNIIVPFEYKSITDAHDTENKVKNSNWIEIKEQGSDECYLLDISTGETFLKNCGYTDLTVSVNDLVIAKKDGKTKIITLENQVLLEPSTNVVSLMEYNDTVYGYYKNKEGLDDGSVTVFDHNFNTVVVAQDWGSFWNYRDYGIYIFQNDSGNMGAYDYDGNIVVPFKYQSVKALNSTHYVVQQHNQYYLFDSQSQSIVSQPYDSVYFNQELVIAEKNGKQSFFNHNCEPIHLSGDSITTLVDTADEDTHYLDNQDGSKSIVIPTISDSGKKGAVLISSFQ